MAPAHAATDWTGASAAWRAQYREIVVAEAAREVCDLDIEKPVRRAMREVREGLAQALSSFGPLETARMLVKAEGGKKAFCANAAMLDAAKATIAQFANQQKESGVGKSVAQPSSAAPIAANAPTPVVDPNIALIRNCRQAALSKLGKKAKENDRFWTTYETCMKDQGVGWF